ncbi:hypothetical protein DEI89_15995 [Curtobacterium sp. MCBD17_030]|nr:hypothetical protein DEI89_15995 [Curtobacterium sp. MCBD17_030]
MRASRGDTTAASGQKTSRAGDTTPALRPLALTRSLIGIPARGSRSPPARCPARPAARAFVRPLAASCRTSGPQGARGVGARK